MTEKSTAPTDADCLLYYDLEKYLFETVRKRFERNGELSASDFFSIIMWKANRAKSKIAKKMLEQSKQRTLDEACRKLTREISEKTSDKDRLRVLLNWTFWLPMATAILSVLYPDSFTVYDYRVRDQLKCKEITSTDFGVVWTEYEEYRNDVKRSGPERCSLRDKDRVLWGRSSFYQMENDIKHWQEQFGKQVPE